MHPASSLILGLGLVLLSPPCDAALQAGAARADITPPLGTEMPAWVRQADGVHDPLYARAVVLDDGWDRLAIISLDECMFVEVAAPSFHDGPESKVHGRVTNVRREIRSATGIDKVIFVASHTHSSGAANAPETWLREEERRIAGAVVEAAAHARPARIGVGWGTVHEGFNRRLPRKEGPTQTQWDDPTRATTGPTDPSLGVISIQAEDGKTIATLVNFACHGVILGPLNTKFSADYPGAFARKVEQALGGECLFLQGAAGDIDPFVCLLSEATGANEELDRLGAVIADETVATVARIKERKAAPRLVWHSEVVPLASRMYPEGGKKIEAEIDTILIGDELALATFPGEFFVEHGLRLKQLSPVPNTFFVGYCNGFLGYFPTIKASMEGGYGAVWRWWAQTEIGAGETLVNRAAINLGVEANVFKKASDTTVMPKR